MTRQDMLGCLEEDNPRYEKLDAYINEIEKAFDTIKHLLNTLDIRNVENITEACEIATSMGNELY